MEGEGEEENNVVRRRAPINQFAHMRAFPDATYTDIVSPNADTLYSLAWLDLAKEPMVLSVPDDRRALLPDADHGRLDQRVRQPRHADHRRRQGQTSPSSGRRWKGKLPDGRQGTAVPDEHGLD